MLSTVIKVRQIFTHRWEMKRETTAKDRDKGQWKQLLIKSGLIHCSSKQLVQISVSHIWHCDHYQKQQSDAPLRANIPTQIQTEVTGNKIFGIALNLNHNTSQKQWCSEDQNNRINSCVNSSVRLSSTFRYDTDHVYDAVASERLGRSESYQEQYVFVYRWAKQCVHTAGWTKVKPSWIQAVICLSDCVQDRYSQSHWQVSVPRWSTRRCWCFLQRAFCCPLHSPQDRSVLWHSGFPFKMRNSMVMCGI